MSRAFDRSSALRGSRRSRLIAAALAVGVTAGLILLFMTLGVVPSPRPLTDILATFDVRPPAPVESRSESAAASAEPTQPADVPPIAPTPPPPIPEPPTPPADIIMLTRRDFAAADIGAMPRRAAPVRDTGAAGTQAVGRGPGDSQAIGTGPDGQPLYNAQWYREPTRAEMATYLPRRSVSGDRWGMIVCRTIERNRVDDCRELGEAPGSGLAGAMRQAAWQFQVRPPRRGGVPLIGAWVRIRFDYVDRGNDDSGDRDR